VPVDKTGCGDGHREDLRQNGRKEQGLAEELRSERKRADHLGAEQKKMRE